MAQTNVLVVEDDDKVRELIVAALNASLNASSREQAPIDVDGARDGRDALHQIQTKRYRVIILDVMMPFMSGIDFLDSLQALLFDPSLKKLAEPPEVIVLTGCPTDVVREDEVQHRFPTMVREVLRKPIDMNELASRLQRLL
jgi:CheY-like chemotaxis protein